MSAKELPQAALELEAALELTKRQQNEVQAALGELRASAERVETKITANLNGFTQVRERLEQMIKGMREK